MGDRLNLVDSKQPHPDHGYIEGPIADPPPIVRVDAEMTLHWSDHEHQMKTWMYRGSGYSGDTEVNTCSICRMFARQEYFKMEVHPESCRCEPFGH